MLPLHRGRFVVVDLYSAFSVDPQMFPLGQLYTKNFGGCKPTFWKLQWWNLVWGCGPGSPSPGQILPKNHLCGYTHLGKIYTKNYQFWQFWGYKLVGRLPPVDEKLWCFFALPRRWCGLISSLFFLSHFGMTKFVITEMLWSSVIFKTVIVPLHRRMFVLCSCAPIVKFFDGPQNFPLGANLYQKLPFLAISGTVSAHFQSHNGEVWLKNADLGQAKFCIKNR